MRKVSSEIKKRLRKITPGRRLMLCLAVFSVWFAVLFTVSYIRAIPVAVMTLETVSKGVIEKNVVSSAEKAISENESNLFRKITNANGDIISLEADINAINALCANVVKNIYENMDKMGSIKIKVPVGNTMKTKLFHGVGPDITVRATPYVAAYAHIDSSFTDAGINQTLHRMILTVTTDVTVVCADKTVSFTTESRITVSEEIIVGGVPDGFIY